MPDHSIVRERSWRVTAMLAVTALIAVALSAMAPGGPARADGSGSGWDPLQSCPLAKAGLTRTTFFETFVRPTGWIFPAYHQLTTEFSAAGLTFGDDDTNLPATHARVGFADVGLPLAWISPTAHNSVSDGTLYNPYRIRLGGGAATEVQVVIRSTVNVITHRLTAFDAAGNELAAASVNSWEYPTTSTFILRVTSPAAPIDSVVFTQVTELGVRTLGRTVVTCIHHGTPTPPPPPTTTTVPPTTTTVLPPTTTTPAPTTTAPVTTTTAPPPSCPAVAQVASVDSWVEQGSSSNFGNDSALKVQAKLGTQSFRALVNFPMPVIRPGCVVDTARLSMYAESAKPGRSIVVQRAAAAWSESAVTWANQPARIGVQATAPSLSDKGWMSWTITQQVLDIYSSGGPHGFVVFDSNESGESEQVFKATEAGGTQIPLLQITFRPGTGGTTTTTVPPTTTTVPPSAACPTLHLSANADAWLEQGSTSNLGADSVLKVQSKDQQAFRALVRFSMPSIPAGCVLQGASLQLFAATAKPGRSIAVRRAGSAWGESTVTWSNQPAGTGPITNMASGEESGWRAWSVTPQVREMYATGQLHGFVVSDSVETDDAEQVYRSREAGSDGPLLVLQFSPI